MVLVNGAHNGPLEDGDAEDDVPAALEDGVGREEEEPSREDAVLLEDAPAALEEGPLEEEEDDANNPASTAVPCRQLPAWQVKPSGHSSDDTHAGESNSKTLEHPLRQASKTPAHTRAMVIPPPGMRPTIHRHLQPAPLRPPHLPQPVPTRPNHRQA